MTVKELIEKYQIREVNGGRIYAPVMPTAADKKTIAEKKPEILAYLRAEKERKEREYQERVARFDTIPGVKEIREVAGALERHREAYNRAWESGKSVYPVCSYKPEDLEALRAKYPDAAWALMVYDKKFSDSYEISAIAERAYNAILDGATVSEVRETYEKELAEFRNRNMWD